MNWAVELPGRPKKGVSHMNGIYLADLEGKLKIRPQPLLDVLQVAVIVGLIILTRVLLMYLTAWFLLPVVMILLWLIYGAVKIGLNRELRRTALVVENGMVTRLLMETAKSETAGAYTDFQDVYGSMAALDSPLMRGSTYGNAYQASASGQRQTERAMQNAAWIRRCLDGVHCDLERWYDCTYVGKTKWFLKFTGAQTPGGKQRTFRLPNVYLPEKELQSER